MHTLPIEFIKEINKEWWKNHPQLVIDYKLAIAKVYPSFAKERRDVQDAFIRGLACANRVVDKQLEDGTSYYTFTITELKKMNVRAETFYKKLESYPFFVYTGNQTSGFGYVAKKYVPTEDYLLMLNYYESLQATDGFYLPNDRVYVSVDDYFDQEWEVESDAVTTANVNVEEYEEWLSTFKYRDVTEESVLKSLLSTAKACNGTLEQHYWRCKTGRLVSKGVSLQNVNKKARNVLLKGEWDYDFQNAHYNIIANLFSPGELPTLEDYAANPSLYRVMLANKYDIDEKHVKTILIAFCFGLGRTARKGSMIAELLGKEKAKAFVSDPLVRGILKDLDMAKRWLLEEGRLEEELEIPGCDNSDKALAYHCQRIEAALLDVVREEWKCSALFYDGWIMSEDVDVEEIEDLIERKTGFIMPVVKQQIV